MRRREFHRRALGGAAAWPVGGVGAEQAAMPVIGYLSGPLVARHIDPFLELPLSDGLREAGYREGENLAIEYRWAAGRYDAAARARRQNL